MEFQPYLGQSKKKGGSQSIATPVIYTTRDIQYQNTAEKWLYYNIGHNSLWFYLGGLQKVCKLSMLVDSILGVFIMWSCFFVWLLHVFFLDWDIRNSPKKA